MPANGLSNQQLVDAAQGQPVWLNYKRVQGAWTPDATRANQPPVASHGRAIGTVASAGSADVGPSNGANAAIAGPATHLIAHHGPTDRRPMVFLLGLLVALGAAVVAGGIYRRTLTARATAKATVTSDTPD